MDNARPIIELLEVALTVAITWMIWQEIGDSFKLRKQIETLNTTSVNTNKNLETLISKQESALKSLEQTNKELQDSVQNSHDATIASRSQLKLMADEQNRLSAERSKAPKLVVYVNGLPLVGSPRSIIPRKITPTRAVVEIQLINDGNKKATSGTFRTVVFSNEVTIENSAPSQPLHEIAGNSGHSLLTHFDFLRPKVNIPMTITLSYPKSQTKFSVQFAVDTDETGDVVLLGALDIDPPRQPNLSVN